MLLRFLADSLNYSDFIKGIEKLTVAQMEVLYIRLQQELLKKESTAVSSSLPAPANEEQTKKIVKIVTEKLVIKPKSVVECCLHCGSINIKKKGFTKGKIQRYLCHDCGKTFSENYGLITHYTHLSEWQWQEIIRGTVCQLSITEIAKNIGASKSTVWSCRLKVYQTISNIYGNCDRFNNIVEVDGKYERISFKGMKNKMWFINKLGRLPRHHMTREERHDYLNNGGFYDDLFKNKPWLLKEMITHKNGAIVGRDTIDIDHQKVCILTAVDRTGNLYVEPITAGKPTAPDIKKYLTDKIESDAVLVTDELKQYNYYSYTEQIEHVKIASDKHSKGAFSLSRVNSLHSAIDRFMCIPEYRPATKYLDLYLKMFWWFQKNKDMNKNDQTTLLFSIMTGCVDAKDRAKMTRITIAELNARSLPIDTKGYY